MSFVSFEQRCLQAMTLSRGGASFRALLSDRLMLEYQHDSLLVQWSDNNNCKTVPTLVQIFAMRCYASNDVVHARSIYRLKACRINVTHGLCDADRPNKTQTGLMLKFNVCCGTQQRRRAKHPWWRRRRPRHSRGSSKSYSTSWTGSTRSRLRTPICTARCISSSRNHSRAC